MQQKLLQLSANKPSHNILALVSLLCPSLIWQVTTSLAPKTAHTPTPPTPVPGKYRSTHRHSSVQLANVGAVMRPPARATTQATVIALSSALIFNSRGHTAALARSSSSSSACVLRLLCRKGLMLILRCRACALPCFGACLQVSPLCTSRLSLQPGAFTPLLLLLLRL